MLVMPPRIPATPSRSPSDQLSSSPLRSSPLNPSYRSSNPPSQRRASLHNQFQTQSRYKRPVPPASAFKNDIFASDPQESPKNAVWREAFRRKVAERAERDRANYRNSKRTQAGSDRPGSSDVETSDAYDAEMEVSDMLDDELYGALMRSERRKTKHAYAASYERDVGSSFDPDMEDFDQLEAHFAPTSVPHEPSPPPDIESEVIFSDDFEAPSDHYPSSDYEGDVEMDMEASSSASALSTPTASPTKQTAKRRAPAQTTFVGMLLGSPCPNCHAPYSLHVDTEFQESALVCAVCTASFRLGESQASWDHHHSQTHSSDHNPLAVFEPNLSDAIVLFCSEPSCTWAAAL